MEQGCSVLFCVLEQDAQVATRRVTYYDAWFNNIGTIHSHKRWKIVRDQRKLLRQSQVKVQDHSNHLKVTCLVYSKIKKLLLYRTFFKTPTPMGSHPGVINSHGHSPHLTACWSPTCSLTTAASVTTLGDLFDFGQLFKALGQQLICPNLPHSQAIFEKVSKSFIFPLKSYLGNFYRHLAIFFWSH